MKKTLVPRPCHEDWDRLTPEERGHFCTVCETKVWDLSALTAAEAETFLRSQQGDLCVSYKEGPGGEVLHREPTVVPAARLSRRRMPAAAGMALALAACTPTQTPQAQSADSAPTPESGPEAQTAGAPAEEHPVADSATETGDSATESGDPTTVADPIPEPRHVKGRRVLADELDEPPSEPEPPKPTRSEEQHVKGKWAPADEPEPTQPPIKMGKVAR